MLIGILITVILGSTMNSKNLQGFFQIQRFAKPTSQDAFQVKQPSKIYLAYPSDGSTVFKYYNESTMCNVLSPGADPTTDPYCLTFTMSPISDLKISYLRLQSLGWQILNISNVKKTPKPPCLIEGGFLCYNYTKIK